MTLIERDDEFGALLTSLADCHRGAGSVVQISGSVASGKSELLTHFAQQAAESGALVLRAGGSRAERNFPLGVIAQLLHSASLANSQVQRIRQMVANWTSGTEPACGDADDLSPETTQLIYTLCLSVLDLTVQSPVVVAVDDVQYADRASLQWLLHMVRRSRSAPLVVVVTKPAGPDLDVDLSSFNLELTAQPNARRIRLGPLSASGVRTLLAKHLGPERAKELTAECYAVTGGNPLLLRALIEDNLSIGDQIPRQHGGRTLVGDAFHEAALVCVHRGGPAALAGARGLAILNSPTGPRLLPRFIDVKTTQANHIMQVLEAAGLISQGRFVSEDARRAVLDDLPGDERSALYLRAAELLRAEGAPPASIASHLVAAGEPCPPWGLRVLLTAADLALAEDQVGHALEQLRLAEQSCSDSALRASIDNTLAQVEWRMNPAAPVVRVPRLLSAFTDGHLSPTEALFPIECLLLHGRLGEATPAIEQLTSHPDEPAKPHIHAFQLWIASSFPTLLPRLPQDPEAAAHNPITLDARLRAPETLATVLRLGPLDHIVTEAERVLQGCRLDQSTAVALHLALLTLVYADQVNRAAHWCDLLLKDASTRHAPAWHAMFAATRASIALRQGDLPAAETHVRSAFSLVPEHGWGVAIGAPLATLVYATIAMGKHDEAAKALMVPVPQAMRETRWGLQYLHARGTYHLALNQLQAALSDFLTCGELMMEWNIDLPALIPWRGDAAHVYLRLGQDKQARQLAKAQLNRPGAQHSRTHGISLRALAACSEIRHRPHLLQNASEELLASGDKLEFARALAELGHAYKLLRDPERARMTLQRARYVAKECHSETFHAKLFPDPEELVAEPEDTASEITTLSDAERRVAALAAIGHSNREIAGKLYITISTVEQHLTRVYRKLDVHRRTDLPIRLRPEASH